MITRLFSSRGLVALLFILSVAALHADVVDKVIDKSNPGNRAADGSRYVIVICARGGLPFGHAFVIWGLEGATAKVSSETEFGFYPAPGSNPIGMGLGANVPGDVKAEALSRSINLINHRLIVTVDKAVFDDTNKLISKWQTGDYNLYARNCKNFAWDVAKKVGLAGAAPVAAQLPLTYVAALIDAN